MHRRAFLQTGLAGAAMAVAPFGWCDELPADVRITRIVGFHLQLQRNKVAGKNARLDVHGDKSRDRVLRIHTNAGIEGLGAAYADEAAARELLGKSLSERSTTSTRPRTTRFPPTYSLPTASRPFRTRRASVSSSTRSASPRRSSRYLT